MYIAIRDAMVPIMPGNTIFHSLRELNIDSIEIWVEPDGTTPHVPTTTGGKCSINSQASVRELKLRLGAERVRACALCLPTDFSSDDADKHVEWSITAIRAASELGAPAVRIDTATRNEKITPQQSREMFIQRISKVLRDTKGSNVDLGIENHGRISNDPAYLDGVFAAVGDPRLGMTLDTGNFYWWGHPLRDLYKLLERFAPAARHTHVKNINYPREMVETQREIGYEYGKYCSPLDEGNIEMKRVVEIFQKAGYARGLCIEDESLYKCKTDAEKMSVLKRDAGALRAALAGK